MPINEDEFLAALIPTLNQAKDVVVPPGDDCAAIVFNEDTLMLFAVDQVVEDVHYAGVRSGHRTDPNLAGRKLVARNVSDIAAMGGTPKYALTAIGMPRSEDSTRLEAFATGVKSAADAFGLSLIGGDLTAASSEFASLTIIGTVPKKQVCLRANAKAGERVFVTGAFGGSLASGRHLTFEPRADEGRWLAGHGITTCMIDVSDGLIKDLSRLAQASGLSAVVNEITIPKHDGCSEKQALYDGEDYELIFSVHEGMVQQLLSTWPFAVPITDIGYFTEAQSATVYSESRPGIVLDSDEMFDHFSQ